MFMNQSNLKRPAFTLAALACLAATVMSCEKKSPAPVADNPAPKPVPAEPAKPATPTNNAELASVTITNPAPVHNGNVTDTDIATTTTNAKPAAPAVDTATPIAATHPAVPAPAPAPAPAPVNIKHVEMPEAPPAMPTNFFPAEVSGQPAYYFNFRAGYEHINYRDNHDAAYVGAKFYAHNDKLRVQAGKNAWLVPDAEVEVAHHLLAKPDADLHPGTAQGVSVRAEVYWPWFKWTLNEMAKNNCPCPLGRPITVKLGPVASVGWEKLDAGPSYVSSYAGARLNLGRDGFVEYTVGRTGSFSGTRQQLVAELPVSVSRDGEVRYVLRGTWNHSDLNHRDILAGGLFLEMPFTTIVKPSKWSDLIPFKQ
jgi:hypothetical protein